MDFQKDVVRELFEKKRESNKIEFTGINQFFPENVFEILLPYWERELGRLVNPLPDLKTVLGDLKTTVGFLVQ